MTKSFKVYNELYCGLSIMARFYFIVLIHYWLS